VLRIEDTDRDRSKKEYEQDIFEGLAWLGLTWDEGPIPGAPTYRGSSGPYRQSERGATYKKYLELLLEEKRAYFCYCTKEELEAERQTMLGQGLPPKYGGHCRELRSRPPGKKPEVIRFKTPESRVEFKDVIRGKVEFDASTFGDIVIAKDLESPLYNFAAVVDDYEMRITHVIRGEDHISNTPKQILLQKALNFPDVIYAHLPLILNPDRTKLSKRYNEMSLLEYRKEGYLPAALVNFLALLGWHSEGDQEIFTLKELIREFDIKRVQKAGAAFNLEKLDWLNKEYLKNLSTDEIVDTLIPFLEAKRLGPSREFLSKIVEVERSRMKNLNNFFEIAGFFFALPDYDPLLLVWQKEPASKTKVILKGILEIIDRIKSKTLSRTVLAEALADLAEKEGRGPVFWPLRVAVSGQRASPDPLEIIETLGYEETRRRIETAIKKIDRK